jgi:hypothetical protein
MGGGADAWLSRPTGVHEEKIQGSNDSIFHLFCTFFLEFRRRNLWEPYNEHDVSVRSTLRTSEDSKKSQQNQGK